MLSIIWRVVQWLALVPLLYLAIFAFWILFGLSIWSFPPVVKLAGHLNIPAQVAIGFATFGVDVLSLGLITTVLGLYVGLLLNKRPSQSAPWGFSAGPLFVAALTWFRHRNSNPPVDRTFAILSVVLLFAGAFLALRRHRRSIHWKTFALSLLLLSVPLWVSWATAPKQPRPANPLWTVTLKSGTWTAMNTSSEFSATRQMVIAGDRIVAVFDSGYPTHHGKVPMTTYRLVSMRLSDGKVENTRDLEGHWGAMPSIFANAEGRVVSPTPMAFRSSTRTSLQ